MKSVRFPHKVQPEGKQAAGATGTRWLHGCLMLGMVWLIFGMAILPAGVSYNPGKLYQRVLALTLFVPALALLVMKPRRWLDFWRQPLMPWVVLLLAWGCLTLLWGHTVRPEDQLGHNVSLLLFLFAWQQGFSQDEWRTKRLLVGSGIALALVASAAIIESVLHPESDGRLVGFGVMANANLAAGAMGAALLWLWPWRIEDRRVRVVKWLALGLLALFVLLTLTRSAMAALFAALVVVVVSRGGRRAWLYAGLLLLMGAASAVAGAKFLLERGLSLRPEIFVQSVKLFLQHPWLGLGEGSPFQFHAGGEVLTHAHNMYSQLAIELGLPGLLLWSGIWLALGWRSWCHRHETLGVVVLGLWVFSSILVQFDLPHLIDSPRPSWLITWLPLALGMSLGQRVTGRSVSAA
jgi:O-antigen ligase